MTEVNHYRIWCDTESAYVYTWDTVEPTTCPNDSGHAISGPIVIMETVSTQTIKAEENSDGYFETTHIVMDVLTGKGR